MQNKVIENLVDSILESNRLNREALTNLVNKHFTEMLTQYTSVPAIDKRLSDVKDKRIQLKADLILLKQSLIAAYTDMKNKKPVNIKRLNNTKVDVMKLEEELKDIEEKVNDLKQQRAKAIKQIHHKARQAEAMAAKQRRKESRAKHLNMYLTAQKRKEEQIKKSQ